MAVYCRGTTHQQPHAQPLTMSKRYFPNNWEEYRNAPDDAFSPYTFEEVMSYKVHGWELPSSVALIMRVIHQDPLRITEHVYQRVGAAQKRLHSLLNDPSIAVTIADHDSIHYFSHVCDDEAGNGGTPDDPASQGDTGAPVS